MGAGAIAAALVLQALLGATDYEVAVGTTGRERTLPGQSGSLSDLELDPRVGLAWTSGEGDELGLAYYPQLRWEEQASGTAVLHQGALHAGWRFDPRWRLLVGGSGSYGDADLLLVPVVPGTGGTGGAGQPAQPGPGLPSRPLQPLPAVTRLPYLAGQASLGVDGTPGPRTRFQATVSGSMSGASQQSDRAILPLQYGVLLATSLDYTVSRVDVLATGLTAAGTWFDQPPTRDGTAQLTETWRRTLGLNGRFRLGAGPALAMESNGGSTDWLPGVAGEIGIGTLWGQLDLDLGVRASPVVDRVTTSVYHRADATGTLRWTPHPGWTLSAAGTAGVVLYGTQGGDRIGSVDARAAWSPHEAVELSVGGVGVAEIPQHGADQWDGSLFATITFRERGQL